MVKQTSQFGTNLEIQFDGASSEKLTVNFKQLSRFVQRVVNGSFTSILCHKNIQFESFHHIVTSNYQPNNKSCFFSSCAQLFIRQQHDHSLELNEDKESSNDFQDNQAHDNDLYCRKKMNKAQRQTLSLEKLLKQCKKEMILRVFVFFATM